MLQKTTLINLLRTLILAMRCSHIFYFDIVTIRVIVRQKEPYCSNMTKDSDETCTVNLSEPHLIHTEISFCFLNTINVLLRTKNTVIINLKNYIDHGHCTQNRYYT